ncbi:MAG: alkaline phosphatase family protein [Desulfobulbaceae bacterium]|nr:alkaline phosphatase family protein [Desulfobulbaceae bacterium]
MNSVSHSRCLLVLLDGLGDRSYPELGHKTPLQAARTPHLDSLAALGANGLFHAARPGIALPSENAHFAMFGYSEDEFPGRGYLEALGADLDIGYDEVAILAHFVSVKNVKGVLHIEKHRPEIPADQALDLIESVASRKLSGMEVSFAQTTMLDGILKIRGPVSPLVSDTDPVQRFCPMLAALPHKSAGNDPRAQRTAEVLNTYLAKCHHVLESHPVNIERRQQGLLSVNAIVTQRAGQRKDIIPFQRRWGMKGLSIASGLVYRGLGKYIGLDVHQVRDGKDPGADLAERIDYAVSRQDCRFVHVHTKTPDAAAHSKSPARKVEVIESLDRGLVELSRLAMEEDIFVVVTADHSTPSSGPLIHSGEWVPFTVVGPGIRRDLVQHFDEVHCGAGSLGQLSGGDFMPLVLNWLDCAKLQGLMDTADDQPYWPGKRIPFRVDGI